MEFIFLPFDLDPSLGQYIFHGSAVELCKLLIEFTVRDKSLSECVDCSLLIAKWDGDLLLVEASNIIVE